MEKIKVLVLSHMYPTNSRDTGIFIHNQVKHLQKAGCHVKVISPVPYAPKCLWFNHKWKRYGNTQEYDTTDKNTVYFPRYIHIPGKLFHGLASYSMYWGIKKVFNSIMKEFKPQILHAHTATADGYVGLILSKRYNLPLICSLRGSDINIYPYRDRLTMFLTKKVISNADQIVSVSHALKTTAETIAKPRRKIRVIYNGCDIQAFAFNEESRLEYRKKMGILPKEKVIIFIGWMSKSKGVFELIDSFIKLNSKYPDLRLIFVGGGQELLAIENIISSNNLNKKVHIIDRQPQNEIAKYFRAADIYVLPTYYEGLPSTVLEAMACGLPVVATNVGGIPEIVTEETGVLIPPKNVEKLTEGINSAISRKWDRDIIRRRVEGISWKGNADRTIKIYEELLCR